MMNLRIIDRTRFAPLRRAAGLTLLTVLTLGAGLGCEEAPPAPTGAGNATGKPSTVLGKSVQMGKETAGNIEDRQAELARVADAIGKDAPGGATPGEGAAPASGGAAGAGAGPTALSVGGVNFNVPAGWTRVNLAPGSMRAAEFKIAGTDGRGEASVVFFQGIGGDAGANIVRWSGQVRDASGQPVIPDILTADVNGMKISRIGIEGTYTGMTPGGGAAPPQAGTRFLGAVIEFPDGQVQVRVTGPIATVRAAEPAWEAMLAGVTRK